MKRIKNSDRHVIWALIDGCNAEVFYDVFFSGKLPNLRHAMKDGIAVRNAYTCFPSVTVVCLAASFTGNHFKNTGIVGNVWYDRTWNPVGGRAYLSVLDQTLASYDRRKFGFPNIILPDNHKGGLVNNDISDSVKTIYEVLAEDNLTSCSMFNYVGRGASFWFRPTRMNMLTYAYIDKRTHNYAVFDRQMMDGAIWYIQKHGLPNLLTLYFGGHDGHGHKYGVNGQGEYLQRIVDVQIGRLLDCINAHRSLDGLNFIVSADHGQTDFPRGGREHKILWKNDIRQLFAESGVPLRVDGGETHEVQPDSDILFAIGTGGSFSLYIKNRKTRRWIDPPDYEADVVPIANLLLASSDPRFASRLYYLGDYLSFIIVRRSLNEPYMIYENNYPCTGVGKLLTLDEYFSDKKGRYPDAVEQIRGLEHPARAPDIIAVLDYDEKGYYLSGCVHGANHGHLCADDTRIPLMFAGSDIRGGEIETCRIIDIAPTVASLFGLKMPSADGKPLDVKN
ncbi:MAG: alkaline phosphatase family protein [bacterium]